MRKGEEMWSAQDISHRAVVDNVEYLELVGTCKEKIPKERAKWSVPEPGMLKFNIDGAFTPGQDDAAWGVLARDHVEDVVACKAGRVAHISDAFSSELQAMIQVVDLAVQLGAIWIVIETDSIQLAQALNRREPDFSKHAVPIEDLKMQTRLWFSCEHCCTSCCQTWLLK